MNYKIIMPCIMMVFSLGSSVVYFFNGDVRKGIYWLAATALTASVTF